MINCDTWQIFLGGQEVKFHGFLTLRWNETRVRKTRVSSGAEGRNKVTVGQADIYRSGLSHA